VVMVLGVTGNVLPWDEQGYWAIQVELGIAESAPGGSAVRTLVQGGSDSGNLLLTRLYTIHTMLLPAVALALLAGIVVLSRRPGTVREVVQIDRPLTERGLGDADLEARQKHLWTLMRDEARAADAELLDA